MEYYQQQYQKIKHIFPQQSSHITWSRTSDDYLVLYDSHQPLGTFEVVQIAYIKNRSSWFWIWEMTTNMIEKTHCPHSLKDKLHETILQSKGDHLIKIIACMYALQAVWYVYIQDRDDIMRVFLITKIINV